MRPAPTTIATNPPRRLLMGGGLTLGLICGLAGAALLGEGDKQGRRTAEVRAAAAARSQLGGGVSNSEFTRKHESLLASIKAGHIEAARKLSPEGRLKLLLDLFQEGRDKQYAWDPVGNIERQIRLNASILPEDIPRYMELLADPNSSLSKDDRGALQNLVLRVAAQENMQELLKKYKDADPKFAKALQAAFDREAAQRDPFEGIRQMQEKKPGKDGGGDYFNTTAFSQAAQQDPERALREAQKTERMSSRQSALGAVLASVGYSQGFDKAWAMSLRIKESGMRFQAQNTLISSLSQLNPEMRQKMLDFVMEDNTNPALRDNSLRNIVSSWSNEDPRAAMAWAQQYVKENGEESPNGRGNQIFSNAMYNFSRTYPDEALPMVLELPANQRQSQISSVFDSLAGRDVDKALAMLDKVGGKDLETARNSVVQNWSQQDPEAAAKYVSSLGQVPERENLYSNLISGWSNYDSMGASQWLAAQPVDTARDRGISSLVNQISNEDPEAALLWSYQYSTPSQQKSGIRNGISTWAQKDPAAAGNWVRAQTSSLEPDLVAELLKTVEASAKQKDKSSTEVQY